MTSPRVVITDHVFKNLAFEQAVADNHGAKLEVFQCTDPDEVTRALDNASVALVNQAPVTREAMEGMTSAATIVRYGVGVESIDLTAARELGVQVANVPDYGFNTVADHTVTLLLSLLRKVSKAEKLLREKGWAKPAELAPILDFPTVTVGLIGLGRNGLAVANRLLPFGFQIIAHDPYADPEVAQKHGVKLVPLDELFRASRGISLHTPLTPETRHLISSETISLMPEDAVIINTSRGELIDTEALVKALREGRLGGAGLDVFEIEPLPAEYELRHAPNVTLTPHLAFYSDASLKRLQQLAADEVSRALSDEPLRSVVA